MTEQPLKWMVDDSLLLKIDENVFTNITFINSDGTTAGTLSWGSGQLEFKGNIAESAQIFIDYIKKHWII